MKVGHTSMNDLGAGSITPSSSLGQSLGDLHLFLNLQGYQRHAGRGQLHAGYRRASFLEKHLSCWTEPSSWKVVDSSSIHY